MISRTIRISALTALGAIGLLLLMAGTTAAQTGTTAAQTGTALSTTIGGVPVAGSSDSHPIPMSPKPTELVLRVTNGGRLPIVGRTVRLSSTVLGLDFFAYETAVEIRVAPGATEERRFTLDLSALKGQATGVLPASISVLDQNRHELAAQEATVEVDGSKFSMYGIFGIVLFLLTAVGLGEVLLALSRNRLSPNRWSRGIRFFLPGIGLGLVLVIGSSVFSVFAPRLTRWLPIVTITALILFAVGYFSPTPQRDDELPPGPGGERTAVGAESGTSAGASGTLPPGRARSTLPPGANPPA